MEFGRLLSKVTHVEQIAAGSGIHMATRVRLRRDHGPGRWRKMKGRARVESTGGEVAYAEVHWYEAHGKGRVDWKIKTSLESP